MFEKSPKFKSQLSAGRKGRAVVLCGISFLLFGSLLNIRVRAAAGDLDLTFGSGGKVTTDLGFSATDVGHAFAVQSDGKIVVVGDGISAARYNPDGSLDASFGIGGRLITGVQGASTAVAVQTDGRIVIAGFTFAVPFDFLLIRLNTGGDLDTSFGSGGVVTTDFFSGFDIAQSMAIQSDGKILAGGVADSPGGSDSHYALARYNADGTLDSSFGSGGKVFTTQSPSSDDIFGIEIQGDHRIVATGLNFLVRYNVNGSLDSTFGSGGLASTNGVAAESLALQPDGRIVVAGFGGTAFNFAVGRFDSSGNPDQSFGTGGVTVTVLSSEDVAFGVAVQSDNKIVVAGYTTAQATGRDFAIVRYNPNGTLDTTFGSGGKVITDFAGGEDIANGVAIQSDQKILAVGLATNSGTAQDFALARYDPGVVRVGETLCIQDDRTGDRVSFDVDTGSYTFTQCGGRGISFSGSAKVQQTQCSIQLKEATTNQKLSLTFDRCQKKASATITNGSQTFTIVDSETSKDTCSCR